MALATQRVPGPMAPEPSSKNNMPWANGNGSLLCDMWLRYRKCSRKGCRCEHRDAMPGEMRPMCRAFFQLKDGCTYGTRCCLSHRQPPSSPDQDTCGTIQNGEKPGLARRSANGPTKNVPETPQTDSEKDKQLSIIRSPDSKKRRGQVAGRGLPGIRRIDGAKSILLESGGVSLYPVEVLGKNLTSTPAEKAEKDGETKSLNSEQCPKKSNELHAAPPADKRLSKSQRNKRKKVARKALKNKVSSGGETEETEEVDSSDISQNSLAHELSSSMKRNEGETSSVLGPPDNPPAAQKALENHTTLTKRRNESAILPSVDDDANRVLSDMPTTVPGLSRDAKAEMKSGVGVDLLLNTKERKRPEPEFVSPNESSQPKNTSGARLTEVEDTGKQGSAEPYRSIFSPEPPSNVPDSDAQCPLIAGHKPLQDTPRSDSAAHSQQPAPAQQPSTRLQPVLKSPLGPTADTTSSTNIIMQQKSDVGLAFSENTGSSDQSSGNNHGSDGQCPILSPRANDKSPSDLAFYHQFESLNLLPKQAPHTLPATPGHGRDLNARNSQQVLPSLAAHLQRPGQFVLPNTAQKHTHALGDGLGRSTRNHRQGGTMPEWELLRCFNCWSDAHIQRRCPDPKRSVIDKELLRDSRGVISRRWTELILTEYPSYARSHGFYDKHMGYSRIWQPYYASNGIFVTPNPALTAFTTISGESRAMTSRESSLSSAEYPPKPVVCPADGTTSDSQTGSGSGSGTPSRELPRRPRQTTFEEPDTRHWTSPAEQAVNDEVVGSWNNNTSSSAQPAEWNWNFEPSTSSDSNSFPKPIVSSDSDSFSRHALGGTKRQQSPPSLAKAISPVPASVYCLSTGREVFIRRDDLPSLSTHDAMNESSTNSVGSFVSDGLTRLNIFPVEILENIFTYVADNVPADAQQRVKDVVIGSNFAANPELNRGRTRNLVHVVRTCHRFRLVAQEILFKEVNLVTYEDVELFVGAVTGAPELAGAVQIVRINLEQWHFNAGGNDMVSRVTAASLAPTAYEAASLFVRLVEACHKIQVLSVNMPGGVLGLGLLRGNFPRMRELQIRDKASNNQVITGLWDTLKDFPQLKRFKAVHSPDNQGVEFEPLAIPEHMLSDVRTHSFSTMSTLTLENAPEISDEVLKIIVLRLPVLSKLSLVHCKLVTSGGLAHALKQIPDKLVHLTFWVWVSNYGRPTEKEAETPDDHLCAELRDSCHRLEYLNLRPYRVCGELWRESNFSRLRRVKVEMAQYHDCKRSNQKSDEKAFFHDYEEAREDERLPHLSEEKAVFKLHLPGISFR